MNLFSFYSILSLKGRGNYQLSIINYQLLNTPYYQNNWVAQFPLLRLNIFGALL